MSWYSKKHLPLLKAFNLIASHLCLSFHSSLDFLNMLCHVIVIFNAFHCLSHDRQLYPKWWHNKTRWHCSMWLLLGIVPSLPAASTDILWIWTLTILGNVDLVSASHTRKTTLIALDVAFSIRHRVCGFSPWNLGAGAVQPSLAKAWKQHVLAIQVMPPLCFNLQNSVN